MENVAYGFMIGSRPNETETKPTEKETVPEEIVEIETGSIDDYASRIYVTPEVAKEEIWKRWNNEDLKKEVEKFLGNDVPDCFRDGPKAFLARSIASPNREAVNFLKIAEKLDLKPVFGEYLADKFVSSNFDKRHLAKLFFYDGVGKNLGDKISTQNIIDTLHSDGKPIREITTTWNENLATFHHRIFQEIFPHGYQHGHTVDLSEWLMSHGGHATAYYSQYLALFLCHGVLAELFLLYNEDDRIFFDDTVLPALNELEKRFGVLPLIAQISPFEKGADISWKYYPESIKKLIPDTAV